MLESCSLAAELDTGGLDSLVLVGDGAVKGFVVEQGIWDVVANSQLCDADTDPFRRHNNDSVLGRHLEEGPGDSSI